MVWEEVHDEDVLIGFNFLRIFDGLVTNLVEGIRQIRNELTERDFLEPTVVMINLISCSTSALWRTKARELFDGLSVSHHGVWECSASSSRW